MSHSKVNVYNQNIKAQAVPTGNSRDTDSRALAACAKRLDDVKVIMEADPRNKENLQIYGDAIRHNQRLWTIFQVALCDPQNPLPQDLKVTLLNLSRFIDTTSFRAVGRYEPALIDSLVNINRIIAAGLSKQTTAQTTFIPPAEMPKIDTTSLQTSA
jgi:flagellar protein FlaF